MSRSAKDLLGGIGVADLRKGCLWQLTVVRSLTMQCSFRRPQADFREHDNTSWLKYDWIKKCIQQRKHCNQVDII